MRKKTIFIAYVIILVIGTTLALTKVNILNTLALSPKGMQVEDNYKTVSAEFGEDFENFIQDRAPIKIYNEKDAILINIDNYNFKIKKQSEIINNIVGRVLNFIEFTGDSISEILKSF